ncbi:peptidase M28 [Paenibacillus hunanensis]|uniref:Endoglucanase n=2 Tax=Paenibacillus hunanensis TaxID=539262 RepID=A0ABU1IUP9_9BACL|nr:endoglucanase [Paenibacillus hunanensis]GGJ12771.1 peptidase M28 [Paenibacillus hunanensis]
MDDMTLMMKELTESDGVSGFERSVRDKMAEYLSPLSDELMKDRLGSIIGKKVGNEQGPRVLIAGHLDEIGFLVTSITPKGFLRFEQLGGWWPHSVMSQRVRVKTRKGDYVGIVGSKPPHGMEAAEREKVVKLKQMYIDIGARDADDAKAMGVRPGDWIVPISEFTTMRDDELWVGKALDNRAGCALAVEVLKRLQEEQHPNVLYAGATVQEEVGLRGATTVANLVQPDIAFALDVGIANDIPGVEAESPSNVGGGPLLLLLDSTMIPHSGLRDLVMDTAEELGMDIQVATVMGGGTDAGKFHLHGTGCPTLSMGFATRYIHTHNAIMAKKDFDEAATLLVNVIKKLDQDKMNELFG